MMLASHLVRVRGRVRVRVRVRIRARIGVRVRGGVRVGLRLVMLASHRFLRWLGPPAVLSTRFQSVQPT